MLFRSRTLQDIESDVRFLKEAMRQARLPGEVEAITEALEDLAEEKRRLTGVFAGEIGKQKRLLDDLAATQNELLEDQIEQEMEAAAEREKIHEETAKAIGDAQRKSLEDQQKDFDRFVEAVQRNVADQLFDIFSGRIDDIGQLFVRLKDFILRQLAELVAAAIARPIIVPIVASLGGALGLPIPGFAAQAEIGRAHV